MSQNAHVHLFITVAEDERKCNFVLILLITTITFLLHRRKNFQKRISNGINFDEAERGGVKI